MKNLNFFLVKIKPKLTQITIILFQRGFRKV